MDDLKNYREEIDEIDKALLAQFEKRLKVTEKIAAYKKENGLPIFDALREREKLDKIESEVAEENSAYARLLYTTIMELSKDNERKSLEVQTPLLKEIEIALEQTPKLFPERATVACQGVTGAYSQLACEKAFKMPKILYMQTFGGVFSALESGLCQYGVLPLENSTAGSVNSIYDLMMKHKFHIVKSIKLKIDHSLLAPKGVKKEDIREIFSHEQALLQCADYLKQFPNAKITVCENTAASAKLVADSKRADVAALASYSCGALYGLNCLEEDVQDNGNNYTRFICIAKNLEIFPGADKTSLMLVLPHKPGALYNVLSRLYALDINILKLESRPIPNRDFHFMFYFDLECSVYSNAFLRLIGQLEELSSEIRYLGSYVEN